MSKASEVDRYITMFEKPQAFVGLPCYGHPPEHDTCLTCAMQHGIYAFIEEIHRLRSAIKEHNEETLARIFAEQTHQGG